MGKARRERSTAGQRDNPSGLPSDAEVEASGILSSAAGAALSSGASLVPSTAPVYLTPAILDRLRSLDPMDREEACNGIAVLASDSDATQLQRQQHTATLLKHGALELLRLLLLDPEHGVRLAAAGAVQNILLSAEKLPHPPKLGDPSQMMASVVESIRQTAALLLQTSAEHQPRNRHPQQEDIADTLSRLLCLARSLLEFSRTVAGRRHDEPAYCEFYFALSIFRQVQQEQRQLAGEGQVQLFVDVLMTRHFLAFSNVIEDALDLLRSLLERDAALSPSPWLPQYLLERTSLVSYLQSVLLQSASTVGVGADAPKVSQRVQVASSIVLALLTSVDGTIGIFDRPELAQAVAAVAGLRSSAGTLQQSPLSVLGTAAMALEFMADCASSNFSNSFLVASSSPASSLEAKKKFSAAAAAAAATTTTTTTTTGTTGTTGTTAGAMIMATPVAWQALIEIGPLVLAEMDRMEAPTGSGTASSSMADVPQQQQQRQRQRQQQTHGQEEDDMQDHQHQQTWKTQVVSFQRLYLETLASFVMEVEISSYQQQTFFSDERRWFLEDLVMKICPLCYSSLMQLSSELKPRCRPEDATELYAGKDAAAVCVLVETCKRLMRQADPTLRAWMAGVEWSAVGQLLRLMRAVFSGVLAIVSIHGATALPRNVLAVVVELLHGLYDVFCDERYDALFVERGRASADGSEIGADCDGRWVIRSLPSLQTFLSAELERLQAQLQGALVDGDVDALRMDRLEEALLNLEPFLSYKREHEAM